MTSPHDHVPSAGGTARAVMLVVAALPLSVGALVALVVMLGGFGAAVLSGGGGDRVPSASVAWLAAGAMALLTGAAAAAVSAAVARLAGQQDATPVRYGGAVGLLAMALGGLLGLVGVAAGDIPAGAVALALPLVLGGGVGTAVVARAAARHGPAATAAYWFAGLVVAVAAMLVIG